MESGIWPGLDLCGGAVKKARAEVKPVNVPAAKNDILHGLQDVMREKVEAIMTKGDLTADVFDVIAAKWLRESSHHEMMVSITADEIMEARGLQKQKSGSGRRGGYKEEWRQAVEEQINFLSEHWINVGVMEAWREVKGKVKKVKWSGEGRALNLDFRVHEKVEGGPDRYIWRVRPGSIFSSFLFGPGRQTALLSNKALNYDHYREHWEKRLTRYFAYLWRIDEGRTVEGVLVKTLLEKVGEEVNKNRPSRTRARLEKALDRLRDDDVITGWEYHAEEAASGHNWWKRWIESKVLLTAPEVINSHYKAIREKKHKKKIT